MKKQLLVILVIIFAAVSSCKKEKNIAQTDENINKVILLSKVTNGSGVLIATYTYSTNNKLTEYKSFDDQDKQVGFVRNIEINADNRATKYLTDYYDQGVLAFTDSIVNTYNVSGQLIRKDMSQEGVINKRYITYQYEPSKVTAKNYAENNPPTTSVLISTTVYQLSADGKNIIEVTTGSSTLRYMNFDDKNSFTGILPAGLFNQPIGNTNNYRSLESVPGGTITYQYQYNSRGYPSKCTYSTGKILNFEYTYR